MRAIIKMLAIIIPTVVVSFLSDVLVQSFVDKHTNIAPKDLRYVWVFRTQFGGQVTSTNYSRVLGALNTDIIKLRHIDNGESIRILSETILVRRKRDVLS